MGSTMSAGATSSVSETSQSPFPFTKLSPEIRAMILEELLIMPGLIKTEDHVVGGANAVIHNKVIEEENWKNYRTIPEIRAVAHNTRIMQAPLVQVFLVSKAVYREAVPIYFGHNEFECRDLNNFARFIQKIGPDFRWQLRKLSVAFIGQAPARAAKLMAECVGLKELKVKLFGSSFVRTRMGMMVQLAGQKDLLRIRGITRFEVDYENCCEYYWWPPGTGASIRPRLEAFVKTLESTFKQPRDQRSLKRQETKDFPPQKARRTVFGETNVVTRSERKMLANESAQK